MIILLPSIFQVDLLVAFHPLNGVIDTAFQTFDMTVKFEVAGKNLFENGLEYNSWMSLRSHQNKSFHKQFQLELILWYCKFKVNSPTIRLKHNIFHDCSPFCCRRILAVWTRTYCHCHHGRSTEIDHELT